MLMIVAFVHLIWIKETLINSSMSHTLLLLVALEYAYVVSPLHLFATNGLDMELLKNMIPLSCLYSIEYKHKNEVAFICTHVDNQNIPLNTQTI
jgi:hypothetical protein